jgi:hypothetical protein
MMIRICHYPDICLEYLPIPLITFAPTCELLSVGHKRHQEHPPHTGERQESELVLLSVWLLHLKTY